MNENHLNWQVTPLNYQHAFQLTPGNKISRYNVLRLSANNKALLVMTKCHCRLWEKESFGNDFRGPLPKSPECRQNKFLFWNKCNLEDKVMVLSPKWRKLLLSLGTSHQENNKNIFYNYTCERPVCYQSALSSVKWWDMFIDNSWAFLS